MRRRAPWVKVLRDQTKKNVVDLLTTLDAALLQRDRVFDNAEAMIKAKWGHELALEEVNAEVASLRMTMCEIDTFTRRLSRQGERLQSEV
ncbi:hypothetical protein ACLOJK_006770 [Asimina triloba]